MKTSTSKSLEYHENLYIKTTWILWKPIHQNHLNLMKTSTSKPLESYENLYIKTSWILWIPLYQDHLNIENTSITKPPEYSHPHPTHQNHLTIMKTSTSKPLESYENLYIKTTWLSWKPLHQNHLTIMSTSIPRSLKYYEYLHIKPILAFNQCFKHIYLWCEFKMWKRTGSKCHWEKRPMQLLTSTLSAIYRCELQWNG